MQADSVGRTAIGKASLAPLLQIDRAAFAASFDKAPFLVEHRLCDHPLFRIDRLLALAGTLPATSVEYNAGELPIGCDPTQTPGNGLSPEETIRRIESCKSWMVLKNVEHDPEYRDLLRSCLGEIAGISETLRTGMQQQEAFIFLSSPGSMTPYHFDPEHNFLLQIRGSKTMTLFDRDLVSAVERERYFSGAHRNLTFDDSYLQRANTFELQPGRGIHVPTTMPHFVRNGPGVSISFSVTFRTPDLYVARAAHEFNDLLRRAGFSPGQVGVNIVKDKAKSLALRAIQKSRRLLK